MNSAPVFHPYGTSHLAVILLTLGLPFALAALARESKAADRIIITALSAALILNYIAFLAIMRRTIGLTWQQTLPMQMCDWAIVVVIVALWTGSRRWFEVGYFWGIGGTLQAVLTPNLQVDFPDFRFISFFISHSGIIISVVYLMVTRGLRPYISSIVRAFLWSELYFVVTLAVDAWTGVNYGFLLYKPEAKTLLNVLSDQRSLYLFQMHLLALVFFVVLYAPFAIADLVHRRKIVGCFCETP